MQTRVRACAVTRAAAAAATCALLTTCSPAPAPTTVADRADEAGYEQADVPNGGIVAGVATLEVPPALRAKVGAARHGEEAEHQIPREARRASGLDGRLPDAVVYLADIHKGRPFAADAPSPLLNQRGMQFEPRVQLVHPGATLEIVNSDPASHNVRGILEETRETVFNYAMPLQNQRLKVALERPGRVNVICDMKHGWMKATLVVMRHPYYAITDAEGRFALEQVPAGEYSLHAWHDAFGERTVRVRVEPGGTTRVSFSFSVS